MWVTGFLTVPEIQQHLVNVMPVEITVERNLTSYVSEKNMSTFD